MVKRRQTSIVASRTAREHSAAAEQVRTSCHIAQSYCARREIREGVERVNGRAHGEDVSQNATGAQAATLPSQ